MDDTRNHTHSTADRASGLSRRHLLIGAAAGTAVGMFASSARATGLATGRAPDGLLASSSGVFGRYRPRFEEVYQEFVRNFAERGEVGASVCVVWEGETVVDLWGGIARVDTATPWESDTLTHVWSSTKGATALCAHLLADPGPLHLEPPVVQYLPEFGQQAKGAIT